MSDDGYLPIEDETISREVRDTAKKTVFEQLSARFQLLVPADPKRAISTIQRVLYATTATVAEEKWRSAREHALCPATVRIEVKISESNGINVRHGKRPEKWFLIHEVDGSIFYVQISDESGRTSRERPLGVKDTDFIETWAPSASPVELKAFLETMISKLDYRSPGDFPFLEVQKLRAPSLATMYSSHRESIVNRELADGFQQILSNIPDFRPGVLVTHIATEHANFRIDGALGGQLSLIIYILHFAASENKLKEIDPSFENSVASIGDILTRIAKHAHGVKWIGEACELMQAEAERHQLLALDSDSVVRFYGEIFSSMLWLWGAYLGFRFLSMSADSSKARGPQISANVCEERMAHAFSSLITGFLDSLDGRAFLTTRSLIARKRTVSGELAAEELTQHYIEVMLQYPRFFRKFLLGAGDTYPIRKT